MTAAVVVALKSPSIGPGWYPSAASRSCSATTSLPRDPGRTSARDIPGVAGAAVVTGVVGVGVVVDGVVVEGVLVDGVVVEGRRGDVAGGAVTLSVDPPSS